MTYPIKELPIIEIEATGATQIRVAINKEVVAEYAERMLAGENFPPVIVFAEEGSERYILADGFTRIAAAKLAGIGFFDAVIREGGLHEALAYALGANDDHGLRRSNRDKENAVSIACKDPEWCEWSNADIARLCRVSDKFVAKVRDSLVEKGVIEEPEIVKTQREGKTVERKAGRSSNKKEQKKDPPKKPSPKSQDETQRDEANEGISLIISIPHDGAEAYRRWGPTALPKASHARDWLDEYIKASKENQP